MPLSREPGGQFSLPGHTVRLRLTLLYSGLFLACGAALLAITYVLVRTGPFSHQATAVVIRSSGLAPTLPGQQQMQQLLQTQATASSNAELNTLLVESGIALAIMAVLASGLGWLVAGRVLRPLRTITTAARNISASNLNARLALDGPDDELKELGNTFDELLGRLERAFAAQRQFVANASHELRTPLARQRTLVEVALADPAPSVSALQATCERVLAAGAEQDRLIEALLTLARSQRGLDRRELVNLGATAAGVLATRDAEAQHRGLRLSAELGPALVLGDQGLAERLAANLVDNALRHNLPGGWAEVRTWSNPDGVVLSVVNTGPEVPAAELGRLFGPFQRLGHERTGSRDGSGLGLSIVAAITDAHGARVRARPRPGGGLEVQVCFPPAQLPG